MESKYRRILPACWILLTVISCGVPQQTPARSPERSAASFAALESRTFQLVNEHRRAAGLAPFAYDPRIAAVARRHSEDMAAGRVPAGHAGFEERYRAMSKTIPLRGFAENVGVNDYPLSETVRAAVSGWMDSPGHRENIEGQYDLSGVGIARDSRGAFYYTQIFVRPGGQAREYRSR